MTIGLYAGSFDPPHLGHLSLIDTASRWCETLFVVAAGNPGKSGALLDLPERQRLLAASTSHLPNVVAMHHAGLVSDLAIDLDVDVLIRCMGKEQATEFEMAVANEMMVGIPTVFLPPSPATHWIASSATRYAVDQGAVDQISQMVPLPVLEALATRARESHQGQGAASSGRGTWVPNDESVVVGERGL